jgi:ketosteroid isomerase-like protein
MNAEDQRDIAAINELYNQYLQGANTGDLNLFISLWDDDAIRLEPDHPAIFGRARIKDFFETRFNQFSADIAIYGDTEIQVAES